jgi:hypothetical protein
MQEDDRYIIAGYRYAGLCGRAAILAVRALAEGGTTTRQSGERELCEKPGHEHDLPEYRPSADIGLCGYSSSVTLVSSSTSKSVNDGPVTLIIDSTDLGAPRRASNRGVDA